LKIVVVKGLAVGFQELDVCGRDTLSLSIFLLCERLCMIVPPSFGAEFFCLIYCTILKQQSPWYKRLVPASECKPGSYTYLHGLILRFMISFSSECFTKSLIVPRSRELPLHMLQLEICFKMVKLYCQGLQLRKIREFDRLDRSALLF
jgi:hypothetical protein